MIHDIFFTVGTKLMIEKLSRLMMLETLVKSGNLFVHACIEL